MKKYQVVTVEVGKLEEALNSHAKEGWTIDQILTEIVGPPYKGGISSIFTNFAIIASREDS